MNFKETLTSLIGTDEIVSVSCNPDDPYKTCCGFVLAVTDEFIILKSVDTYGKSDGFILRRFGEIFRLDRNGEYEQRLTYLYSRLNQAHPVFDIASDNLLTDLLEYARLNQLVVSAGIRDYSSISIYALVKSIDCDNQMVLFYELNDNGARTGGENLIQLDAIKRASILSEDEIKMQLLNQGFKVDRNRK